MQLYVKGGAVVAFYLDGQTVPADAHPGAALQSYAGEMSALARFGDLPEGWPDSEPDPRPYAAPAVDLRAYAASARYAKETAGITVAGVEVATDEGSQAKIGNAYLLLQASGAPSIDFKGADGTFATLTADQFKALALAVGAHVQACFAVEGRVVAAIAAGTAKTPADVDAAFAAAAA